MHANLLIVDHQNAIPTRKPEHGKKLDKGLIEKDPEQDRGVEDFSSTLAEVESAQPSHPGPVDESSVEQKESKTGEAESEDLEKDAKEGLAEAGKSSRSFLVLEGTTDTGSESGHVVEGKELSSKSKVIRKAVPGLNQSGQTLSIGPDKVDASKTDPTKLELEREPGKSEVEKAVAATPETNGKAPSEVWATAQGNEKSGNPEGRLRAVGATPETKVKAPSEVLATAHGDEKSGNPEGRLRAVAATPRVLEKSGNPLMDLREELGRINRVEFDKEPAAQKLRMGSVKGSTEEPVQKEPGIEALTSKLGLDHKDAKSETAKVKVSEGDLTQKKVEKAEPGNGENSNLSSRNFSTPDKGAGAISQPKEPQAFTKSAQADTLRQIVNKAALNVGNGRSEFKIDLKPESLGQLRMQILTENNQVTVRILAENPLVKDMIESNLAQLKANFQNQGLEIEKFDVSVFQDSDQNGSGDGRYGSRKMRAKSGDPKNGYGGKVEEPEEIDHRARRGQGAVNFFA